MSDRELAQFKWKDKQKNSSLIKISYFNGVNFDKLRELVRKDSWGWVAQGLQNGEGFESLSGQDAEEYIKVLQSTGIAIEGHVSGLEDRITTLGRILEINREPTGAEKITPPGNPWCKSQKEWE